MGEKALSVYVISHSTQLAGAERALLEMARILKERGVRIHVAVPGVGPLTVYLDRLGISAARFRYRPWVSIPPTTWWKIAARRVVNILTLPAVAASIARAKADIVYTNTMTIDLGAIAALLLHKPHVWHLHEFDQGFAFDLGRAPSLWFMKHSRSSFIADSKALATHYAALLGLESLPVMYQPVSLLTSEATNDRDPADSDPVPSEDVNCLLLGSLYEGKGQEEAIAAIARLRADRVPVRLTLAGPERTGYGDFLRTRIRELGVDDVVTILGPVVDPSPLYAESDIVLVCSRSEAFGRVVVEAMRAGRAIIATRIGGLEELIIDGVTGLLYRPGDLDELVAKLAGLVSSADERKRLGDAARSWVAGRFTEEAYGDELLDLLGRLA